MSKELKTMDAISSLAKLIQVDTAELKKTLKATVIKGMKQDNGTYKEITDEEFVAFVGVCNAYKLNPLTKEIYAYPDTKSKGIVPVVSTDGWNKLMTQHPDYKCHEYRESATMATPQGGKICPEWMEIVITKKDNSQVVVREYLDECFRTLPYSNPWQTHTKRMLRHKTKIQGAREAFGFGGIYDHDEAGRIIEAQAEQAHSEPEIKEPKALEKPVETQQQPNTAVPEKQTEPPTPAPVTDAYKNLMATFGKAKKALGETEYYKILSANGFSHANEIKNIQQGNAIAKVMNDRFNQIKKEKAPTK